MSSAHPRRAWDDSDDSNDADEVLARLSAARIGAALIGVSILGVLSNIGLIMVGNVFATKKPPPAYMSKDEQEAWRRGQDAAPAMNLCGGCCFSLAIYLPVFLGGLQLQQGMGRAFGIAASVMAMFPCSAAILVGVPVGIWGLVVLNRADVTAALSSRPSRSFDRDDDESDDDWDDRPRRGRRV